MTDYFYFILIGISGIIAYLWKRIDVLQKILTNHITEIKSKLSAMHTDIKWLKERK